MPVEGGFQGRSDKLVDGCYSFWMGGTFAVVRQALLSTASGVLPRVVFLLPLVFIVGYRTRDMNGRSAPWNELALALIVLLCVGRTEAVPPVSIGDWNFDRERLSSYVLRCCQDLRGGLLDKPGK